MKKISILAFVALCACVGCKKASFVDQMHDSTQLWPAYDTNTQLYGYIDASGSFAIKPQFKTASTFFVGDYAVVSNGGRSFFIDKNGKVQSAASFDDVSSFMNNYAVVKLDGEYGMIDRDLQYAIQPVFSSLTDASANGLVGFKSSQGKGGYLNTSGEQVIEPIFDKIAPFIDEVAVVAVRNEGTYTNYYGIIDSKGTYIVHPVNQYQSIKSLGAERLAFTNGDGLCGLMDTQGKVISMPIYSSISGIVGDDTHTEDGSLFVARNMLSNNYVFIDIDGNIKITLPDNCVPYPFCEGYAYVYNNQSNSAYFINEKGNVVLSLNSNESCYRKFVHNGLILTVNDETRVYTYRDLNGKAIYSWTYSSSYAPHRGALQVEEGEILSKHFTLD